MDVLVLIDKLDELVLNARGVPMSNQVRLDRDEIEDIISERTRMNVSLSTYRILSAVEGATSAVYRGSMQPMLGWISRELDRPQPAPTIVWRGQLVGRAVLRTEIAVPAGR